MEIIRSHNMFLIISLTIFIQSSILITAKSLDYPSSAAIPPMSWFNDIELTSLGTAGVKPILVNGNFTCGFHCKYTAEKTCIFAISFLGPSLNDFSIPSPLIVWSANRNDPIGFETSLRFTREGNLILEDGNGASVWSTNTTAMSVSRLSLTKQGNLVLLGENNKVIWQSFDHPTDSLLPGQRLVYGKKLRSSISASNWSEFLYSLGIDYDGSLVAYMETDQLQSYYRSEYAVPKDKTGQSYADLETISPYFYSEGELSVIKLDSDGHLKGYLWTNLSWVDLLGISSCDYC